jgi:DNA-binding transcriptional ArsR family regulator
MSMDRFHPNGAATGVVSSHAMDMAIAEHLVPRAPEAAAFLKALSHEGRLMILCHLAVGERSVTELEHLLGSRQAAVSQQLARLRLEGLVTTRREGKAIYYAIQDPKVLQTIRLLQGIYAEAA